MGSNVTTSGSGNDAPGRRSVQWGARGRWIVVLLAISFLVLHGAVSAGNLLGQANVGLNVQPTVALPTPNPHQPITPELYAQQIVSNMTFNDKVAQMIMMDTDGTQLTDEQRQMVQQQHVGGAILFNSDVDNITQLKQLTRDMQQRAPYPLFTAIDQEGGLAVNRLSKLLGVDRPGEPEIGAKNSAAFAQSAGAQTATDMTRFGLNFNLAPVVDIQAPNVDSVELHDRLYSTDPNVVAAMADAYLAGLQGSGKVVGTLKHFPGLGATPDNPDRVLPVVDLTKDELDRFTFVPYRKLIAGNNVRVIMVTHIMLSKIDPRYPATLSVSDTTGLLRQDLGYKGVIITDDLRSILKYSQYNSLDMAHACLMAAKAGADILMGPISINDVNNTITAFNDAVSQGELNPDVVDGAVGRILALKIRMGLIPLPAIEVTATPKPPTTPTPLPTATPLALRSRNDHLVA